MNGYEIAVLAFAAVAAVAAVAALVVALLRKKTSDGVSARELDAASRAVVENVTREMEYARKTILDSNAQTTNNMSGGFVSYLESLGKFQKENADRVNQELQRQLSEIKTEFKTGVSEMRGDMQVQVRAIREELTQNMNRMRDEMQVQLKNVREDNEKQLGQMRATVEEKLSETLEKRVQDAFKQVSDRLDNVQKGFGEMKELTTRVGNLNKIFANVKTRGTWGEVSLQSLLEQILAPEQYRTQFNVSPRSREKVDFAVVMPGQAGEEVYLPIDAKFPLEDYNRLIDAGEQGDKMSVELARRAVSERVKAEARSINEKYINPPYTTNFAVLYVPNEGLYAELLRDGALVSDIQTKYRVTICGPTTISALLNSLQVGFTTLKIQKKSGEIIQLMQKVREDFTRFTDLIAKVKKQAQTVVNTVDDIENRNRILTKKLDKLGDDLPPSARETERIEGGEEEFGQYETEESTEEI